MKGSHLRAAALVGLLGAISVAPSGAASTRGYTDPTGIPRGTRKNGNRTAPAWLQERLIRRAAEKRERRAARNQMLATLALHDAAVREYAHVRRRSGRWAA